MNNIELIENEIYYTGISDLHTNLFESLWQLPNGITYNSYLINADKKVLIDTAPANDLIEFINNITDIIGDSPLDYLVINHMEPDHSQSISAVLMKYPNIKIIGNRTTATMLNGFYGINDNIQIVNDGDKIEIGNDRYLKFIFTPMIHWPETMMTLDISTGTLFTGDAFGGFGTLNGAIVDKDCDLETIIPEIYRYYSAIVAKYGNYVQRALSKLKGSVINMICPTHGPVWKTYLMHVLDLYDRLSRYEGQDGVVIAYASMYGNTAKIANLLARVFTMKGLTVKVHDLATTDISFALSDAIKYKCILIGSPTYNNDIFPPVQTFVEALKSRGFSNRVFGAFGSYSWNKGVGAHILDVLSSLKNIQTAGVLEMKQAQIENIENNIEGYVDNAIELIKQV